MTLEPVTLRFTRACSGDAAGGIVPYRHYRVLVSGQDVGRINLRIASTELTDTVIGHIGFEIAEAQRGRGYAYRACIALIPEVRRYMPTTLITCNPDNTASRCTIERLDAVFLGELPVPKKYLRHSPNACSKLHFR